MGREVIANDRVERLLGLLLVHQTKGGIGEKALQLTIAGFSQLEIADMLQTTTATIRQSLYAMRKKEKK